MKTKAEILKMREATCYIVSHFPQGVDYIKLFKILYFAQQSHLVRVGQAIVNDTFHALKYGPVPAFIYKSLQVLEGRLSSNSDFEIFNEGLRNYHQTITCLNPPATYSNLTETELRCLDEAISQYGALSWMELSELSHDTAWQQAFDRAKDDPEKDRMSLIEIARAGGATDELITYMRQRLNNEKDGDLLSAKSSFIRNLQELGIRHAGWDGEGVCQSVNQEALANAIAIAQILDGDRLSLWIAYPAANGSITFMAKMRVVASFSIGHDGFSYVAKAKGKETLKGFNTPNPSVFKVLFDQITDLYLIDAPHPADTQTNISA